MEVKNVWICTQSSACRLLGPIRAPVIPAHNDEEAQPQVVELQQPDSPVEPVLDAASSCPLYYPPSVPVDDSPVQFDLSKQKHTQRLCASSGKLPALNIPWNLNQKRAKTSASSRYGAIDILPTAAPAAASGPIRPEYPRLTAASGRQRAEADWIAGVGGMLASWLKRMLRAEREVDHRNMRQQHHVQG